MFGLSFAELVVIGVVVLIVFGPERLPEVASKFGKWSGEMRKTADSFRREFYHSVYKPSEEAQEEIRSLTTHSPEPESTTTSPPKEHNESDR